MYFWSNVIWYYAVFILLGNLLSAVCEQRFPERKFWYSGVFYFGIGITDGLCEIEYDVQYFITCIVCFVYAKLFFQCKKIVKWITTFLFLAITLFIHFLFEIKVDAYWMTAYNIKELSGEKIIYPIISTCTIVTLFTVYQIVMIIYFAKQGIYLNKKGMFYFFVITMFSVLSLYLILLDRRHLHLYHQNEMLIMVLLLGLAIINSYCISYGNSLIQNLILTGRLKMEEKRNELTYEYYKNMEKGNEECKRFFHDIKNHIQVIEALYQAGEKKQAKDYTNTLVREMDRIYPKSYSSNKMVDIILQDKEKNAKQNSIDMHYEIEDTDIKVLSDFEIATILCNLFDNAIACCKKLDEDKQMISFKLRQVNNFLVLKMENSIDPEKSKEMERNSLKKRIREGTGLKNVSKVVKKKEGTITFDITDKKFSVTIMFPC